MFSKECYAPKKPQPMFVHTFGTKRTKHSVLAGPKPMLLATLHYSMSQVFISIRANIELDFGRANLVHFLFKDL